MIVGQGEMEATKHGALRESNEGRGRFDLLPYEAIEALAKWYEEGAKKYDERNWENGISVKDCINRMIRHALKAGNGWTDEDHLAAVMWNAAAAITMMQRRPDCNDHRWNVREESPKEVVWHIDPSDIGPGKLMYSEPLNENMVPRSERHLESKFVVKKDNLDDYSPMQIHKDDRDFLVKAIQCGGVEDYETLKGWVDRRCSESRQVISNEFGVLHNGEAVITKKDPSDLRR